MKRFIITITLLVALVGSAFATNWKKYGTHKDEWGDVYEVHFDYDATEPFEVEKENIRYILNLQCWYDTSIFLYKYYDDEPYAIGAKHNHYSTLMLYKDKPHVCECHVNKDGTVTMFWYKRHKGETIEDIMDKLNTDVFGEPVTSSYK